MCIGKNTPDRVNLFLKIRRRLIILTRGRMRWMFRGLLRFLRSLSKFSQEG
jgi:hypothetical protein